MSDDFEYGVCVCVRVFKRVKACVPLIVLIQSPNSVLCHLHSSIYHKILNYF